MISAYTGTQVREAEKPFLDDALGSGAGAVLMERAAYGLANAIIGAMRGRGQRLYGASVAVLAGKGNNGGDGLFAAALLARRGMRTTAVLAAGTAHDAGLTAFRKAGGHAVVLTADNVAELAAMAGGADVVIDAILGTGAQGGLRGPAAGLVAALERTRPGSRFPLVVACDIPSGVDADTGEAHTPVLAADMTVTFGAAKAGLLTDPGADFTGRVQVIPIGIEGALPWPALRRLEARDLSALLPSPERRAHKYSRGVLGVVAGSGAYPGAAVLACKGALAAGVGMVRYLGRRTLPTWSAKHAPRWCAATAPWPIRTFRPGSLAPDWTTPMSSSCSAPATPQTRACRRSPTPAHCPPCLRCWPRK